MNTDSDFSSYKTVFCDSRQALDWAYENGLSKDAAIQTSSPALLRDDRPNINHVEARWSLDEMKRFQSTKQKYCRMIYESVIAIDQISHEEALCVARNMGIFHRLLFKAACLTEDDLSEPRLFLKLSNETAQRMGRLSRDSPWDYILEQNPDFRVVTYNIKEKNLNTPPSARPRLWNRLVVGGVDRLLYQLALKIFDKLPPNLFRRSVLIFKENELVIETALALVLHGIRLKKISLSQEHVPTTIESKISEIEASIRPIVRQRIIEWVVPGLRQTCEELFCQEVEQQLRDYFLERKKCELFLKNAKVKEAILLTNYPSSVMGLAVTSLCREFGIPVVSAQHGVAREISSLHSEIVENYEINTSDIFLTFNTESALVSEQSKYRRGISFVSGMSRTNLNVWKTTATRSKVDVPPLVYISTKGELGNVQTGFLRWMTDYDLMMKETELVENVLSKVPHKVRFKPYFYENRRYPDEDPTFDVVRKCNNIELLNVATDMRYLFNGHKVIITAGSSSTLSWAIMSGKPMVLINQKNLDPLTSEAHEIFKRALFLFDDDEDGFHERLRIFLSQQFEQIEELWEQKFESRKKTVVKYFSAYPSGAGKRAASMIVKELFH